MNKKFISLVLILQYISCSKEPVVVNNIPTDPTMSVSGKDNARMWALNEIVNSLTTYDLNSTANLHSSSEGFDYACDFPPGRVRGCVLSDLKDEQKIVSMEEEIIYDENYRPIYSFMKNGMAHKFVYDTKGMLDYFIRFKSDDPTQSPLYMLNYEYDQNGRISILEDDQLRYEFAYTLLENIKHVIVYQAYTAELVSMQKSTSNFMKLPGVDEKIKTLLPKISEQYLRPKRNQIESRSNTPTWIPALKIKYYTDEAIIDPMQRVNFGWTHNIGYGWPLNSNYIQKLEYILLDGEGNEIGKIGQSEITQARCILNLPLTISTISEYYNINLQTGEILSITSQYLVQKYNYQSGCTEVATASKSQ